MKVFLILFFILVSCSVNRNTVHFSLNDVTIKLDSLATDNLINRNSVVINNKEFIVGVNRKTNSLDFMNYTTKEFEFRVSIPCLFEVYHVKSLDSIFVIEWEKNILSLFDSGGNLVNTYNFDSRMCSTNLRYVVYASNKNMMTTIGDKFVFSAYAVIRIPQNYNYTTIGIFDYLSDDYVVKAGHFPDLYRNGDVWYGFESSFCVDDKNRIVCSFESDHNIYIYNEFGKLLETKTAKSKYIDEFTSLNVDSSRIRKISDEYNITRPRYYRIIFDKYRNLYYRIVVHKQEYTNPDGSVNDIYDNPWSIIVMDSKFNIIDEVKMDPKKYLLYRIIVVSDGLLMPINEDYLDDDELPSLYESKYTLLKIEVK